MRIYYDCEFLEDGETIRLISIGMVREDGQYLYRIVNDSQLMLDVWKHPWLRKNVIPSLPIESVYREHDIDNSYRELLVWESHHTDYPCIKQRKTIAEDVKRFITDTPNAELWAYYAAYDHVALCQLFGRMIDLPNSVPMHTMDIKQEIMRLGNPRVPEQAEGLHNALSDAQWNKETYEYLQQLYDPSKRLRDAFTRDL